VSQNYLDFAMVKPAAHKHGIGSPASNPATLPKCQLFNPPPEAFEDEAAAVVRSTTGGVSRPPTWDHSPTRDNASSRVGLVARALLPATIGDTI